MSAQVLALREVLERRFPDAVPVTYRTAESVGSGVRELDALLPGHGFPRGRLSVWVPGGGATAVLTAACLAAVARGERAAWVDGAGVLAGEFWRAGPLLVRPAGGAERGRAALGCAEELLASGGFALVVLGGVATLANEAVRLSRAARAGGSAFVALTENCSLAALRLVSRLRADGYRWRAGPFGEPAEAESVRMRVRAASLGWSGRAEFLLPVVHHEVRLSLEPTLVDRRGAQR